MTLSNKVYQISSYSETVGGIKSFIQDLCGELLKTKIQSEIISFAFRSKRIRKLKASKLPILGIYPFLIASSFLTALIFSTKQRDGKFLIHAHDMLFGGLTGVLIKFILRVPLVITDHGLQSIIESYTYTQRHGDTFLSRLNRAFLLLVEKFVATHADRIMCVSEYTYNHFLKRNINPAKMKIVKNAVDVEKFRLMSSIFSKNNITILYAGRISPEKGIEALIKVFSLLEVRHQNLKLIIAGEGADTAIIERMTKNLKVREKITLLPFVDRDIMVNLYNSTDIVMFPSVMETGTPLTLLEAMACERVVVVNSCGSLPYIVYNAGLIAPFNNPLKTSMLIERILVDREKASTLARLARERVVKNFNWQNCFKEILSTYISVGVSSVICEQAEEVINYEENI